MLEKVKQYLPFFNLSILFILFILIIVIFTRKSKESFGSLPEGTQLLTTDSDGNLSTTTGTNVLSSVTDSIAALQSTVTALNGDVYRKSEINNKLRGLGDYTELLKLGETGWCNNTDVLPNNYGTGPNDYKTVTDNCRKNPLCKSVTCHDTATGSECKMKMGQRTGDHSLVHVAPGYHCYVPTLTAIEKLQKVIGNPV